MFREHNILKLKRTFSVLTFSGRDNMFVKFLSSIIEAGKLKHLIFLVMVVGWIGHKVQFWSKII